MFWKKLQYEYEWIFHTINQGQFEVEEVKHESKLASRRLLGIAAGWLGVMHRGPCMFGPTLDSTTTNSKTQNARKSHNTTPVIWSFHANLLIVTHDESYHLEVIKGQNWFSLITLLRLIESIFFNIIFSKMKDCNKIWKSTIFVFWKWPKLGYTLILKQCWPAVATWALVLGAWWHGYAYMMFGPASDVKTFCVCFITE